jgi:D-galactarolactone cycloisomerase
MAAMKIAAVVVHVLRHDLPAGQAFAYSQAWYRSRSIMLVELRADSGLRGWGEAFGPPEATAAVVQHLYAPLLLGRDPLAIDLLWDELYNRLRDHGQAGIPIEALSAVDIALHDLAGRALGVPVSTLLGGARRARIRAYATGLYHRGAGHGSDWPEQSAALAEEAAEYVSQGFRAVKLKVGFGLDEDVRNARAVRQAIGAAPLLMIDANHAYDAAAATWLGLRLADAGLDICWFEEPVPPEDIAGYLQVKQALGPRGIAIAGGEAAFTRYGFRELIARRAVDIAQPDVAACGGLSEARKIATLASTWGVRCLPHVWGSAVAVAAALHFAAALPDTPPALKPVEPLFELDRTPNIFREELAQPPVTHIDAEGYLRVPDGPGLGIEINERLVASYSVTSCTCTA